MDTLTQGLFCLKMDKVNLTIGGVNITKDNQGRVDSGGRFAIGQCLFKRQLYPLWL